MLNSDSVAGKLVRVPLKLMPAGSAVPILSGCLRGKRWIVGSTIHRCWLGFYELEKQKLIFREVQSGTTFWDIGANVGFYSLLASQRVGSGKVFAIEPVPRNLSYLRQHLMLNNIHNVEVLEIAVSDKNGNSGFAVEHTGLMGQLSDVSSVSVDTATLDSLVRQGKMLPPNYVKMDIEGAEFLALCGAAQTFQQFRPVLFLATHGKEVEEQCCRLLQSWNYQCDRIGHRAGDELGEIVARHRAE